MKEKFRKKVPSGPMQTKYWVDKSKGIFDYWQTDAETLIEQVTDVVKYYESIDIKLTNRQLYYQLVGKDYIPNAQEVYKRVCTFITDLRYAGIIDWESIEDKARVPRKPSDWNNVRDIVKSAVYSYRLPRWKDQEYYVEMYCEKEAGINVLETISRKYHLTFGFNKGYSSASAMYDLAKRVVRMMFKGKKVVILYFGDHDPSGLDMIRDIRERIAEFVLKSEDSLTIFGELSHEEQQERLAIWVKETGLDELDPMNEELAQEEYLNEVFEQRFQVVPVSLTMEQIQKYGPPPNPAKITDPRAKWYIKQHGKVSWELDAIDAIELRKIAEEAVLKYLDIEKYNAWIEREETEKQALIDFSETL